MAKTKKDPAPVVEAEITRCPKCGSTEREKYSRVDAKPIAGVRNGVAHTHVVFKYTRCANESCRQARVDKSFENRV